LKTNPLERAYLNDFVACFHPENRFQRRATWDAEKNQDGRWRRFEYDELLKRDRVSLDVFWLKDGAQEDSASLPEPDVIAAEIAEDLRAALEQFDAIAADLASAN
jgi:type I restriction enzyme M protein